MSIGLYIGSFDPLTSGHMDIIKRSAKLFDILYVAVSNNSSKKYLLPAKDRVRLVSESVQSDSVLNSFDFYKDHKVYVLTEPSTELTTAIMEKYGIDVLVRSVRNSKDMEDEYILNGYYKNLKPNLEEIMLFSNMPTISSTFIRECIKYKTTDYNFIRNFVPSVVFDYLNNGFEFKEKNNG